MFACALTHHRLVICSDPFNNDHRDAIWKRFAFFCGSFRNWRRRNAKWNDRAIVERKKTNFNFIYFIPSSFPAISHTLLTVRFDAQRFYFPFYGFEFYLFFVFLLEIYYLDYFWRIRRWTMAVCALCLYLFMCTVHSDWFTNRAARDCWFYLIHSHPRPAKLISNYGGLFVSREKYEFLKQFLAAAGSRGRWDQAIDGNTSNMDEWQIISLTDRRCEGGGGGNLNVDLTIEMHFYFCAVET